MFVFVPRETAPEETRVALMPAAVRKLTEAGAEVRVEKGLGERVGVADADYEAAGAAIAEDREGALGVADLVLRVGKPPLQEVGALKKGSIHISHLDPFRERKLVELLARAGVQAIAMEMIPRSTIAQKMDALSSQANLAGYAAVLVGANRLPRVLPMMSTPAGTLKPSRVFVIGAGVAGLQAIATAKRLGAIVEAFDTRPAVEEQVKSLGGRFVKVDLGETGQTKDGYAKALTEDQLRIQREAMARHCAGADLVITTAQVFGRKAPVIVTADMVAGMKPGSVIVDLAVETGGNVEGSVLGKEVRVNGVTILGLANMPGRVAVHASEMYSNNLFNLLDHFWDVEARAFVLNLEDEIMQGCLITHDGVVRNEMVTAAWASA
jgi:NAD(P) transhydrogenase subunit alpha